MSEQSRWRISGRQDEDLILDQDGSLVAKALSLGGCMKLIQAANFCAGIEIETLTLLNQSGHPTLTQWCEENQRLRNENQALRNHTRFDFSDEDLEHTKEDLAETATREVLLIATELRVAVNEKDHEIERLKEGMRGLIGNWKMRVSKERLPTSDDFISELDALLNVFARPGDGYFRK